VFFDLTVLANMVHVAIVQIIDVITVLNASVLTGRSVFVVVIGV